MSGLRVHSFWFVNPFRMVKDDPSSELVTPEAIISRIGNFDEPAKDGLPINHYPALFPARVAQAFSATEVSINIRRTEIFEDLNDVVRGQYTFTDGVGRISAELRDEVWDALILHRRIQSPKASPAAFQMRLAGFKGVLVVDYRLEGRQIHFRPSMKKFSAPNWDNPAGVWPLEIARSFERPMRMHLNRRVFEVLRNITSFLC